MKPLNPFNKSVGSSGHMTPSPNVDSKQTFEKCLWEGADTKGRHTFTERITPSSILSDLGIISFIFEEKVFHLLILHLWEIVYR